MFPEVLDVYRRRVWDSDGGVSNRATLDHSRLSDVLYLTSIHPCRPSFLQNLPPPAGPLYLEIRPRGHTLLRRQQTLYWFAQYGDEANWLLETGAA